MIPQNMPQQYTSAQNRYHPVHPSIHRSAQQRQPAHLDRHWVCTGCGTAHASMLPEECVNCGATALEFEYAPLFEQETLL